MKHILFLSDIHYKGNSDVSEELIIGSFWKDFLSSLGGIDFKDRYCIIAGDLSCYGTHDNIQKFASDFHKRLIEMIPSNHVAYIPGNHDLNRNFIEKHFDSYQSEELMLQKYEKEEEFDEKVKENFVLGKFKYFKEFCEDKANIEGFDLSGYEYKISPDVSVYLLNTALLSRGGLNDHKDSRTLRIQLTELRSWALANEKRRKILVMHHPIQELTEYAQREIEAMINGGQLDFVVSGHTHDVAEHPRKAEAGARFITLPPLFESKKSMNGYMLMSVGDQQEKLSLRYRVWSHSNSKFLVGAQLTGNDSGIIEYLPSEVTEDFVGRTLYNNLQKALNIYGLHPTWRNRVCIESPFSRGEEKVKNFDYVDVLTMTDNLQIQAPSQFGLTSYARYLSYVAWKNYKLPYVYHNLKDLNQHKIEDTIEDDAVFYGVNKEDIKCWLIDDWEETSQMCVSFMEKLSKAAPNLRIIFLTHFQEEQALEGADSIASHKGFKQLYLQPMSKGSVREIVKEFNEAMCIASNDEVLERVLADMQDMNEHRTPVNCLQLMLAYKKQFEKRPINRYAILKLVLQSLFDNMEQLVYGDALDEDECTYILGHFVEGLFRNNKFTFTENEFVSTCSSFAKQKYMTTKVPQLLQVLRDSQIIISKGGVYANILQFRFANWLCYFAAQQMKTDEEFFKYMIEQQKALYHPEIIEYYTGIDKKCDDLAKMINDELVAATEKAKTAIGAPIDFNIYSALKWKLSEATCNKSDEELAKSLQETKLPDSYKDAMADENYDAIRPYVQDIGEVLDKYYVRNLMDIVKSAGRCLRNAIKIEPELKELLLINIISAWKEIINVLVLLTPILANNGYVGIGGARFRLTKNFSKDLKECRQEIITMIPYNIAIWYLDDIFSDKLMALFESYMKEEMMSLESEKVEVSQLEKHILALMIIRAQPSDWRTRIQEYIGTIDKNSYYLGDLFSCLRHNYVTQGMSDNGYRATLQLYKMCLAKHRTGVRNPSLSTIQGQKYREDALPRYQEEEE